MTARAGTLHRRRDVSGVSGTGDVAEVARASSGKVALFWLGEFPTVEVLDSTDQVLAIHGHHGATVIRWDDGEEQDGSVPGEDERCTGQ